ncbi:MAG: N-acetyl sugar amidotransferase [Desulfobacula sp.]|nr:N-acetyl sugar amidotransferase [Desulfobacula sp.]
MKKCIKCILPETHDTLMFDEEGVCSVCRQIEFKNEQIDWAQRGQDLNDLIGEYKDKGLYDCIVPFSGGKDSTFQLWYIVKELKLKPLVVRFNHWGYRPLVHENNTRTFKMLGVDVFEFTANWHVVRELMLESFKRRGDFCWHCHTGIYAGVIHMAIKFDTPLIFWGESLAEYASWYSYEEKEEVDEKRFNRAMNMGITADDMYEFLGKRVSKRDLWMFLFPSRKAYRQAKIKSICLGSYMKWDTKRQVEIIKRELGWKGQNVEGRPPEYDYEKIECQWAGIRDYAKFIKRGYGRTNHLACIDIRNGRLDREEGLEMEKQYDGKRPASLDRFLQVLQITEQEFHEILSKHRVHPWKFDKSKVENDEPLADMSQWDHTLVQTPVGPLKNESGKLETYT